MAKSIRIASFEPVPGRNTTGAFHFSSGERLQVDFTAIKNKHPLVGEIEAAEVFASGTVVDHGIAVAWRNGVEIDAEALHRHALIQAGDSVAPETFKAWRKGHRLTQVAAGEALGVTSRTIQFYESGVQPVSKTIVLACKGFDAIKDEAAA